MNRPIDPQDAAVIVIEDNPDNLLLIVDLLQDIPVRYCSSYVSGRQFFKFMESKPDIRVDLILLDIQLPQEDGYAILTQIRQLPELKETKVIAVTANVLVQDLKQARTAGFDGFLGKPLRFQHFPEQIERILNGEAVWEPH